MQRAEPHAGIDALFNQIDVTIRERYAKLDTGIFRLKRAEQWHDFKAEFNRGLIFAAATYLAVALVELSIIVLAAPGIAEIGRLSVTVP
jgi:hypothetical protein